MNRNQLAKAPILGRTGNPEDNWLQAERELRAKCEQIEGREDQSATVTEAPPADAVRAAETVDPQSQGPKRSETAVQKRRQSAMARP